MFRWEWKVDEDRTGTGFFFFFYRLKGNEEAKYLDPVSSQRMSVTGDNDLSSEPRWFHGKTLFSKLFLFFWNEDVFVFKNDYICLCGWELENNFPITFFWFRWKLVSSLKRGIPRRHCLLAYLESRPLSLYPPITGVASLGRSNSRDQRIEERGRSLR